MTKIKTKPGRWLYLVGVLVIVAAIIASVAVAVSSVAGGITANVPGQTELNLTKTGTYSLTYSYSDANGKKTPITDTSSYSGLKYTLTQEQGDVNVPVTASGKQLQFDITTAGKYKLSAAYSGSTGPSAVVFILAASSIPIALLQIIFYAGVIIGVVIIILTAVLRKKNRVRE